MESQRLLSSDSLLIWHPCMQQKNFETTPPILIQEAKGVYLYDNEKNSYIDAISSWWVNILGHKNEKIDKAVKAQLDSFAHVMTANFTHEPMIRLAQRLTALTGNKLNKVFFADNGSSAIEAALKMAFQYFKNQGIEKKLFVALENSYHGETLGALSVGDVAIYKKTFAPILLETVTSKAPADKSASESKRALFELEKIFSVQGGDIAAFIIEPLVQCAGNMQMHSSDFVYGAKKLCVKYGILFIADEIAVGFGRTGSFFAYESANITPDIMCLSKGITGGYLPLSVVLCINEIYNAFYDDGIEKAFLHSHSYSGNALGCAAANAVLDIFTEESVLENLKPKIVKIGEELAKIGELKAVSNTRQTGMIAAFEVDIGVEKVSKYIFEEGMKNGVFLRPLGNTVYIMPPYCIENFEIEKIFNVIKKIITRQ